MAYANPGDFGQCCLLVLYIGEIQTRSILHVHRLLVTRCIAYKSSIHKRINHIVRARGVVQGFVDYLLLLS